MVLNIIWVTNKKKNSNCCSVRDAAIRFIREKKTKNSIID